MKKIGIDARLYFQTGVGIYISNLIYQLTKIAPKDVVFYIYLLREDEPRVQFKSNNFIKRIVPYRWHSFSEQISFAKILYQDNLDLMHFTYFSYPILYKKKFISTVHDITPLLFKTGKASTRNPLLFASKHFVFRQVIKSQVEQALAIITPTKTVKKQIVERFGQKYSGKIFPIYEGISDELIKAKQNINLKKRFGGNFIIYIGNFYPHKNVERLVEAFSKIKTETKLVLIGPDDFFSKRISEVVKKYKNSGKVVFYFNPTEEDLVFFYKNALALIHPSLSEGFGLPLVEAAYFGLPIIASNIGVFKEVLGNKYVSFDPENNKDIQTKIEMFLHDRPTFNHKEILKKYSFERMAKATLQLYLHILNSG